MAISRLAVSYLRPSATRRVARHLSSSSGGLFPISARASALLEGDDAALDPRVPACLERLTARRADHCWHKHSTFKQHLHGVWRVLALWRRSTELARCGLYHSAYSNSYVNLAIFDVHAGDRAVVRDDLGEAAEALVYKFCTIPRHELLTKALPPMLPAEGGGGVPAAGVDTRHIATGERVHLSRAELHDFLVFQIADVADQYFGWYDELSGGRNDYFSTPNPQGHMPWALWPGPGRPGLWMAPASRWAALAATSDDGEGAAEPDRPPLPVFGARYAGEPPDDAMRSALGLGGVGDARAYVTLDEPDEIAARDAYWSVASLGAGELATRGARAAAVATLLDGAAARNPHVAEPLVAAAHLLLIDGEFGRADVAARAALARLLAWGTAWDKRVGWEAWVAWARVLQQHAAEREPFPETVMGVVNLGLVKE